MSCICNFRCSSADGKRKTASVSLTCESEVRLAHAVLETGSHDGEEQVYMVICMWLNITVEN